MNETVIAGIALTCAACSLASPSTILSRERQDAVYVTAGTAGQYQGYAIKISATSVMHAGSAKFFERGGSFDLGGVHYFIRDGDKIYSSVRPIFLSLRPTQAWVARGYKCSSKDVGGIVLTRCTGEDGTIYESGFDRIRGLQWLDFFCDSNVDTICRFNLKGTNGVFGLR